MPWCSSGIIIDSSVDSWPPCRLPVDVNTAPRERLLRVPGLGVRNVDRILAVRKHHSLTVADLRTLRVNWRTAAPFVLTRDFNPAVRRLDTVGLRRAVQPTLFDGVAA